MKNVFRELITLGTLIILGSLIVFVYLYVLYAISVAHDTFAVTPTVTYQEDSEGHIISAASSVPYSDGNIDQQPITQDILFRKEDSNQ